MKRKVPQESFDEKISDKKPKSSFSGQSGLFYFTDFTFRWNEHFLSTDRAIIKNLFVAAYTGAYTKYSPKDIAIHSDEKMEKYFATEFDHEWKKIKEQENDKRIHYLIARYCDHPVGFISCELNKKSGRIYIRWATISPSFQRQGIGEKMFNAVNKHFPDNLGMELYTRTANTGSQNFYQKYGCQPVTQLDFSEPSDEKSIPGFIKQWLHGYHRNILYPPKDEAFLAEDAHAFIGFVKNS